jgi:hypothetical protein
MNGKSGLSTPPHEEDGVKFQGAPSAGMLRDGDSQRCKAHTFTATHYARVNQVLDS